MGTNQFLSNDNIGYRNDFGNETEVSAFSSATKSKTQMLAGEYNGEKVREDNPKAVSPTNYWTIELATEPSAAEPIAEAPPRDPSNEDVLIRRSTRASNAPDRLIEKC